MPTFLLAFDFMFYHCYFFLHYFIRESFGIFPSSFISIIFIDNLLFLDNKKTFDSIEQIKQLVLQSFRKVSFTYNIHMIYIYLYPIIISLEEFISIICYGGDYCLQLPGSYKYSIYTELRNNDINIDNCDIFLDLIVCSHAILN